MVINNLISKVARVCFLLKIKIKMNIKLLTVITLLFLYFIFGFENLSYSLNNASQDDISELKILKYLPKDNKTFFISNTKISKIANNIRKNYEIKEQDELNLIKNSLLAYLGINLGPNKLEDIYNNELTITFYDNEEKNIDDVLIVFKIKDKKDIDDILNLPNKIDEPDKLIKIFRENKINYLKYIYRTNDNYIITSSNQKLILKAMQTNNNTKEIKTTNYYFKDLLNNFKNENNILLTKNFEGNKLLKNENYTQTENDQIATIFNVEGKNIFLKSYLINEKKNLNKMSYEKVIKNHILDAKKYQMLIYNDFLNSIDYVKLNSFEKDFLKELNEKLKQNILLLVSQDNWIFIFEKNNKNKVSLEKTNLLEDFSQYSLKNHDIIYTIYSKNILKKEENTIKQSNYKNIFSAESDELTFISNSLIADEDIDLISKEFFNIKGKTYPKYFSNKQINLKNPYPIQYQNFSYLENINYFFKNVINLSLIEFKAIIKQSIPYRTPLSYTETNLQLF